VVQQQFIAPTYMRRNDVVSHRYSQTPSGWILRRRRKYSDENCRI